MKPIYWTDSMLRCVSSSLATIALAAASPTTLAAAITNIFTTNVSSADFALNTATELQEFRTLASAPSAGALIGDTASFTSHMAWMSAYRVPLGAGGVAQLNSNLVSYDLSFTVDDPLNQGYDLSFDAAMRGFANAFWESNSGTGVDGVFSAGTLMTASLDSGAGFVPVSALATTTGIASANSTTPDVNLLIAKTGSFDAGSFSGTRAFTLRFSSAGNNTIGALQNFNTGEADLRFGLDPTLSGFLRAEYPGADGESIDTHGHFVTVNAEFRPAALPEPETFVLLLSGLAAAWLAGMTRKSA